MNINNLTLLKSVAAKAAMVATVPTPLTYSIQTTNSS